MKVFWAYVKDESGQTSTEYILLLAVVALFVFKFKNIATGKLEGLLNGVFGNAEEMVQEIGQQR